MADCGHGSLSASLSPDTILKCLETSLDSLREKCFDYQFLWKGWEQDSLKSLHLWNKTGMHWYVAKYRNMFSSTALVCLENAFSQTVYLKCDWNWIQGGEHNFLSLDTQDLEEDNFNVLQIAPTFLSLGAFACSVSPWQKWILVTKSRRLLKSVIGKRKLKLRLSFSVAVSVKKIPRPKIGLSIVV